MARKSINEYFMDIAEAVSSRATCDRKHVGAVIVRDSIILSTGYNGSISGMPHCDDVGHDMDNGHCVATIHAECNAILQAAKNGVNINDSSIYITTFPCWSCFKMLVNAGIKEIFYRDEYGHGNDKVFEAAAKLHIDVLQVDAA